ncbi:MAG: nucleotide exchange factor GrpE [Verrucomicrobiota bacterium]
MAKKKDKETVDPQPVNNQQNSPEDATADVDELQDNSAGESAAPDNELEGLRRDLQEANDRYVRARAEIDNYRKRTQREIADSRTATKAGTIEEFLTVFDHFQMAMNHAETSGDTATLKQGMDMILKEFERAFQNLGVEQISAEGQPFDPALHHAVAEEPNEELPPGSVVREWKPGYRLGDRLIRPASVVVSKGPEEAPNDDSDDSGDS